MFRTGRLQDGSTVPAAIYRTHEETLAQLMEVGFFKAKKTGLGAGDVLILKASDGMAMVWVRDITPLGELVLSPMQAVRAAAPTDDAENRRGRPRAA